MSETLVRVEFETPRFAGSEGGVVSAGGGGGGGGGAEHAAVATFSCACCEEFPAASKATTAKVYDVPHVRPVWLEEVEVTEAIFVPLPYTS